MKRKYLNKTAVQVLFEESHREILERKNKDKPAVRQAWNDFTDDLSRSGQIPERGREWVNPFLKKEDR